MDRPPLLVSSPHTNGDGTSEPRGVMGMGPVAWPRLDMGTAAPRAVVALAPATCARVAVRRGV